MKKRILSMLLAVLMLASLLPTAAMAGNETAAEENNNEVIEEKLEEVEKEPAPVGDPVVHTHNEVSFDTEITTEDQLRTLFEDGGSGYLVNDIKLEGDGTLEASASIEVKLCLNGKTLDLNEKHIKVGKTLSVYDCGTTTTGTITNGKNEQFGGAVYLLNGYVTFNLYGGQITNCEAEEGGAVCLHNYSTFNMYGGTISGCSALRGGAVDSSGGTFHMYGGSITGNTAVMKEVEEGDWVGGLGGGVYNESSSVSVHMHGGSITGNKAARFGGGIFNMMDTTFDGKCIVKDNYAYYGYDLENTKTGEERWLDNVFTTKPLDLGHEKSPEELEAGSEIGVTLAEDVSEVEKIEYTGISGRFLTAAGKDEAQYFTSDADAYYVVTYEDENNKGTYISELVSRIIQDPAKENEYTVGVKMDGLTKEMGYSDPAKAETDLIYEWTVFGVEGQLMNDILTNYPINTGTKIMGESSVSSNGSGLISFTGKTGITEYVTFKSDTSGIKHNSSTDYELTEEDGLYTCKPKGDTPYYFNMYLEHETTTNYTITDITFYIKTEKTLTTDTDAKLDNGAEDGKTYKCYVTFKDGSWEESKKTVYETAAHSHDWTYTAKDNVITAACTEGCDYDKSDFTLTLTASDVTYDGNPHGATITESSIAGQTELPTIEYFSGSTKLDGVPSDAGTYTAKITVGDATAVKQFKINSVSVKMTISGDATARHTDVKTYTVSFSGDKRPCGTTVVWDITGGNYSYVGGHIGTDRVTIICEDVGTLHVHATLVDYCGRPVKGSDGKIIEASLNVKVQAKPGNIINMITTVAKTVVKSISKWFGR